MVNCLSHYSWLVPHTACIYNQVCSTCKHNDCAIDVFTIILSISIFPPPWQLHVHFILTVHAKVDVTFFWLLMYIFGQLCWLVGAWCFGICTFNLTSETTLDYCSTRFGLSSVHYPLYWLYRIDYKLNGVNL